MQCEGVAVTWEEAKVEMVKQAEAEAEVEQQEE